MVTLEQFLAEMPESIKTQIESLAETRNTDINIINSVCCQIYNSIESQVSDVNVRYSQAVSATTSQLDAHIAEKEEQKQEEKTLPASAVGYIEQKKDLNKIDFTGLPNYNVMSLWNTHCSSPYVYPELVFQNALMWDCGIVMKRVDAITEDIFGKPFDEPLYTIIYSLGLAPTGSCKTTLFRIAYKSLKRVIGNDNFAPIAPAPETLLKKMAESVIETTMDRETGLIEKQEFKYAGLKYPNSWKNMWDEELGGFWGKFKKPYMAGIEPTMCSLFSGEFPPKSNSGEKQGNSVDYVAEDPFLGFNGYTVPENMKMLDNGSSDNGYYVRHVTTKVTYDIPLPPKSTESYDNVGMLDFDDDAYITDEGKEIRLKALDNAGMIIDALLDMNKRDNKKLRIRFHPKALQIIKNWEITMRDQFKGNPHIKKMRSRHLENAYKIAMLIEIGNVPYHIVSNAQCFENNVSKVEGTYTDVSDVVDVFHKLANYDLNNLKGVRLEALTVSPETMEFTLKMFDRIYLQHGMDAGKMLMAGDDVETEKVYSILDDAKRITKAEALERKDDIIKSIRDDYAQELEKLETAKPSHENTIAIKYLKERIQRKCDEAIETLEELPEDTVITTITKEKLGKKFRNTSKKLEPILLTLKEYGILFPYKMKIEGSKKPTNVYIYIKDNTTELILPEFNYENYTGTGRYSTGMKFYRRPVGLASLVVESTKPVIEYIEPVEPVESQIHTDMTVSTEIQIEAEC